MGVQRGRRSANVSDTNETLLYNPLKRVEKEKLETKLKAELTRRELLALGFWLQ